MAGETIKSEAICLSIRPWSKTSHVVSWLTPTGRVSTVVKGAVRPKSLFLGQYDLNYTCEILYYARAHGELHALRDCAPIALREGLRSDYRALAVAGYYRRLVEELAPMGRECGGWFRHLGESLDALEGGAGLVGKLIVFELESLRLSGLRPDFGGYDRAAAWSAFSLESGSFGGGEGRSVRVSREVAAYLSHPSAEIKKTQIPLDAARVIGVFYRFHLDCASDVRRAVLGMLLNNY